MTTPICDTCNDTHRTTLTSDGEVDQVVMCTRCPVPCADCRSKPQGAFCATTPCGCACHAPKRTWQPPSLHFGDALELMRRGGKARRQSWPARWFISIRDGQICLLGEGLVWTPMAGRNVSLGAGEAEASDLLATDWVVMP